MPDQHPRENGDTTLNEVEESTPPDRRVWRLRDVTVEVVGDPRDLKRALVGGDARAFAHRFSSITQTTSSPAWRRSAHEIDHTMRQWETLPRPQRRRFENMTPRQARRNPAFRVAVANVRARAVGIVSASRCEGGRPRVRQAARRRSTARSGTPPGDEGPGEPPQLRLAPPPRAVLTFGCLTAQQRGEDRDVEGVAS